MKCSSFLYNILVISMSKFVDLTNQVFGDLKVIKRAEDRCGRTRWLCKCSCGKIVERYAYDLKHGNTTSCGCKKKKKISKSETIHGMSKTKFYKTFHGMKQRCYNLKNKRYKNYGGRGIIVEWKNFSEFYHDMYDSYLEHVKIYGEKNTTIDRIDVNKNYSKENCRWATWEEQALNTTRNIKITYHNKEYTVEEISKMTNLSSKCIYERLSLGWDIERIFKKEKKKASTSKEILITYQGETHNLTEWSKIMNMSVGKISYRYHLGWDAEKIFYYQKETKIKEKTFQTYNDYKDEIILVTDKIHNLIHKKFGALTVIARLTNKNGKIRWLCKCDCGNYCDKLGNSLTTHHTTSCGCKINRRGITKMYHQEYIVWNNIKQWCYNSKNPKYQYYGKKGIKMSDVWKNSFQRFLNDVGKKPEHTILSRKDEFQDFTKENCYWKGI